MKKQATIGSILDSFQKFYPAKVAAEEPAQGKSESSVPEPSKDSDAEALKPADGTNASNKASERGVETSETLPDAPKNIPTQELERKQTSPSEKIASDSTDELVNRLKTRLTKLAEENAKADPEAEALKPSDGTNVQNKEKERGVEAEEALKTVNADKVATAAVVTTSSEVSASAIDLDVLAAKTAAFIANQQRGYEMGRQLFGPSATQKSAAPAQPVPSAQTANTPEVEETRVKLASYVESKVAAQVEAGTLSPQQAEVLLTDLGYETQTAKLARLETAVDQKVAALREQIPGITDEQIMAVLKKDAEVDAAAMAAEAPVGPEAALPPEAAAGGIPPEVAAGAPADPAAAGAAPAGAPDEAAVAQSLQQAIGELQAAVESGQMTEEQALQLLQEAGLDVEGMLAAAQGAGGAPAGPDGAPVDPAAAGLPPEAAPAGLPPEAVPAAAPAPPAAPASEGGAPAEAPSQEPPKEAKSEAPKEEKSDKKDDKKEAAANIEALVAAIDQAHANGTLAKKAESLLAALA